MLSRDGATIITLGTSSRVPEADTSKGSTAPKRVSCCNNLPTGAAPPASTPAAHHAGDMDTTAHTTGLAGFRALPETAGRMSGSDADVLRVWRNRCCQLRALWPVDTDVSTWEGVSFGIAGLEAAARVVQIDLSHRGLTGEVPAELGRLTALQGLHLGNNQLTGALPAALGRLTALQGLHLGNNQLTGVVPAEFGQLSALQWLCLSRNQLEHVPSELGRLVELKWLHLDSNRLTSLPVEFGQFASLTVLTLGINQLTKVPAAIGRLRDRGVKVRVDHGVTFE